MWSGRNSRSRFLDSRISQIRFFQAINGKRSQRRCLLPLQGQSKHIANFSLLYKDDNKSGINAQLAFGYTSKRINTVSQYLNNDIWQKGFAQMDFSIEKKLAKRWFIYAKVNNLFNTPYQLEIQQKNNGFITGVPYQKTGHNVFIRKDTYGINYLLGVKFKM